MNTIKLLWALLKLHTLEVKRALFWLVVSIIVAWGAAEGARITLETAMAVEIDNDCRNLGAFTLQGKFYACEPKEWNHSDIQE